LSVHNTLVIPRTPVKVTYATELISVDGVDEKEGILRISTFENIGWSDHRFQWDPSAYSGITHVNIPSDRIWRPDLRPYAILLEEEIVNLIVYADGSVLYVPPMRLAVPCAMQFAYYPYDTHTCTLRVESWSYDSTMINVTLSSYGAASLNYYTPSSQWKIESFTVDRNTQKYDCCPQEYIDLQFRIKLQRQVQEYHVRVLAPAVVTSLLLLLCFLIPPDRSERVIFCSVLLLCVLLQLFHLNLTVPIRGSDAPYLADFLCFSVFLAFFAIVESVVSLNLAGGCLNGIGICNNNKANKKSEDGQELEKEDKPADMGTATRIARFIDVICFAVFTFIFAVAGGVLLNQ
jgi:hypothetical protein